MEHVTRHVIYSRFWHRFLYDQGYVPTSEPYKKRSAQGLILGPDGDKMSKSKGNVVNPMDVVSRYGADTLRVYILFIGDYEQATPWSESGVKGASRFLDKVYRLQDIVSDVKDDDAILRLLHQTIDAVSKDIEAVKFNTAIAKLMTFVNEAGKAEKLSINSFLTFLKLLNPFAPHLSEELHSQYASESLVFSPYPKADSSLMEDFQVMMVISVNGKVRDKIEVKKDLDEETLKELALKQPKIQQHLDGMTIIKWIIVKDKLINIVVKPG
jgi:leucyl-tRNA synthetase